MATQWERHNWLWYTLNCVHLQHSLCFWTFPCSALFLGTWTCWSIMWALTWHRISPCTHLHPPLIFSLGNSCQPGWRFIILLKKPKSKHCWSCTLFSCNHICFIFSQCIMVFWWSVFFKCVHNYNLLYLFFDCGVQYMIVLFMVFIVQFSVSSACLAINKEQQVTPDSSHGVHIMHLIPAK